VRRCLLIARFSRYKAAAPTLIDQDLFVAVLPHDAVSARGSLQGLLSGRGFFSVVDDASGLDGRLHRVSETRIGQQPFSHARQYSFAYTLLSMAKVSAPIPSGAVGAGVTLKW